MSTKSRNRDDLAKIVLVDQLLNVRQQSPLVLNLVNLINHENHWHLALLNLLQDQFVLRIESKALKHEQNHINIPQRADYCIVHDFVQRFRVLTVETGGVYENTLRFLVTQNAKNPVAGCLRLARGDADLLTQ